MLMPELLIDSYGPVQVFEHTSGQHIARCTAPGCRWKFVLWNREGLLMVAARHEAAWH
jgi:hypothetical protein